MLLLGLCHVVCCFFLIILLLLYFFFFFQAEDGIRDIGVTGVQTCALPISAASFVRPSRRSSNALSAGRSFAAKNQSPANTFASVIEPVVESSIWCCS